jgi:carbonic anhydrase
LKSLQPLLDQNAVWAETVKDKDAAFFSRLSKQQKPDILWIGCSDSRVPPNKILDLPPGELFVHRNIANIIDHSDLNSLSVIQFAVEVLQVPHIIVCGHYGCGGVKAAMEMKDKQHGLIDNWLRHVEEVSLMHADELSGLSDEDRYDRLCELNVAAQVNHVCRTSFVQDAWKSGRELAVHGWIDSLGSGMLNDLDITVTSNDQL